MNSRYAEIQLIQLALHEQGLYGGKLDGVWGPKTQAGFDTYCKANSPQPSKLAKELIRLALGEVSTKEVGKNGGTRIREYQAATEEVPGSWPWCAAFICWLFLMASKTVPFSFRRPTTAAAFVFEEWARGQSTFGVKLIKPPDQPLIAGDIIIFSWSHIGILIENESNGFIKLVEGNTSSDNEGSQNDGDGVWKKTRRSASGIRSAIRV